MHIERILDNYIDSRYQQFQSKICFTKYSIKGIKIPILRKIAHNLLKEYSYLEILNNLQDNSFEEVMLEGLVIAYANTSYENYLKLITNYLPKIDNWAICDVFCNSLKFIKNYQKPFLEYLNNILENNNQEYYLRFCLVCLLNYYLDSQYFSYTLEKIITVKSDYYYVKMAVAWTIATCLSIDFEKTLNFLQNNKDKIDTWTYNKALQKGRESLKLNNEQKNILQNLKK